MAVTANIFANMLYPGVKLIESTAGSQIGDTASFSTTYMMGSAAQGTYRPTLITSIDDFRNVFLSSPSEKSIVLFFNNNPNGILYFTRVAIAVSYTVFTASGGGGFYTIFINGIEVTYQKAGVTTNTEVASYIVTQINSRPDFAGVATAKLVSAGTMAVITSVGALPMTVTATAPNMAATNNNYAFPTNADFIYTIQNTFSSDENWEQGFLIAPEAFQSLTVASDRVSVGNAMEQLCQSDGFDWVALVDCGANVYQTVDLLRTAGQQYNTARGHLGYYAPYLLDLFGAPVPPSAAVAAVAGLRYANEGFQEPIGGSRYRLQGVLDVAVRYSNTQQSVLNPLGINLIRYFQNRGVLIWGLRSRAFDANYTQLNQRVVMNVVNGTLRKSFNEFPFSAIDGEGVLLHRISETATAVLRRLWLGKALYGGTEEAAFLVRCNFSNNTDDQLSNGQVLLECFVAITPGLEKLAISVVKVNLGNVPAA